MATITDLATRVTHSPASARRHLAALVLLFAPLSLYAQDTHDGIYGSLDNIYRLSDAKTFSISPENFTGEKGKGAMAVQGSASNAARDLGQGWKVNPFVVIEPGQTFTLAEINGSGSIQHIWMTPTGKWRFSILRMYWDDETTPSVEFRWATSSPWVGISTHRSSRWQSV